MIALLPELFAQNYVFEYDVEFYMQARRRFWLEVKYKTQNDNNEHNIPDLYFSDVRGATTRRITGNIKIPASRGPITLISAYTERKNTAIFGSTEKVYPQLYISHNNDTEFNMPASAMNWGAFDPSDRDSYSTVRVFRMYPELSIDASSTSSYLPFEEKVLIAGITGFPQSVYKWQYSMNQGNTWVTVPSNLINPSNPGQLRISASDIMPESEYLNLLRNGANIQFRIYNSIKSSNIVVVPLRFSSPHITGATFEIENCHGSADASVTLTFERPLKPDEKLQIFINNQVSPNDADIVLDASNSYTVRGLASGAHTFTLVGSYYTRQTYTGDPAHRTQVTLPERPRLEYAFTKKDISCHDGEDGQIILTAAGGAGNYNAALYENGNGSPSATMPFTASSPAVFRRLPAGRYQLRVSDSNGCVALAPNGSELIHTVELLQPLSPVSAVVEMLKNPLAHGFSDGEALIRISGGTQINGGYTVACVRSDGAAFPAGPLVRDGADYLCTIGGLPDGDYLFRVEDANYPSLDNQDKHAPCGCLSTIHFEMRQPQKIVVRIEESNPVSCNGDSDGQLAAHGVGGIRLTGGMPYAYTWFDISTGQPKEITQQNDSILSGIPAGSYQVKITDANNISTLSDIYQLNQPDSLRIIFETQDAGCAGGSGKVKAVVTGGTAPYSYQWNKEGETGEEIAVIEAGDYMVRVTDQRGCALTALVEITAPGGLEIDSDIKHPSCYNGSDGAIGITLSGATPPYKVRWKDDNSTELIRKGLPAGEYEVVVTDVNGCESAYSFTLDEPEELTVTLGDDFTLCKDQSRLIKATCNRENAGYEWYRDGQKLDMTAAEITVAREGIYKVVATNGEGCTATGEIVVKMGNDVLTVDFTVPTAVVPGSEIHAVNISTIAADKTMWILPAEAAAISLTDTEAVFSIDKKGSYSISMEGFKGDCSTVLTKTITVTEDGEASLPDDKNPLIKQFLVTPNPTKGAFKVLIELNKKEDFTMLLYSPAGVLMDKKEAKQTQTGVFEYDIRGELTGAFMLHLITRSDKAAIKIVKEIQ